MSKCHIVGNHIPWLIIIKWASTRENLSSGVCEQQRCRPACASAQSDQRLCFRLLESIISKLATSGFSIFYVVSVAEQAGLSLALSETPKTGFDTSRPKWKKIFKKCFASTVPLLKKSFASVLSGNCWRTMCGQSRTKLFAAAILFLIVLVYIKRYSVILKVVRLNYPAYLSKWHSLLISSY